MRLHLAAVALAVSIVAAPASAAPSAEFYSIGAVQVFMGKYRPHTDESGVPPAIRALSEHGALREPENAGTSVGEGVWGS